jgi:hypothetical protein
MDLGLNLIGVYRYADLRVLLSTVPYRLQFFVSAYAGT